jgi:hypothetical protein|tara:strand:+ start:605 stop:2824 length:2220 start_codon:yes stop_codon:yes gene_type:complete
MSILQRTMFANGDAVNSPVKDPLNEIANYSLSGLAPIQIFEIMQADYAAMGMEIPFGLATIERIAQQMGGSMKENPNLVGPNIPTDVARAGEMGTKPFNIFPETVDPNLSADPTSKLGSRLRELNPVNPPEGFDITEQLNNLGAVENISNPNYVPSGVEGFELLPESSDDGLPVVTKNPINIKDNQVIIGDRTWTFEDIDKFEQDVKDGMLDGTDLYPILNADGVERGSEIQRILDDFKGYDEPEMYPNRIAANIMGVSPEDRVGSELYRPGDFGSGVQDAYLEGKRGVQTIANVGIGGINLLNKAGDYVSDFFQGPDFQGAFKGQRGREAALERENPPVENVFDYIPLTEEKDIAAMRLDQMPGAIKSDTISQDIEDLEKQAGPTILDDEALKPTAPEEFIPTPEEFIEESGEDDSVVLPEDEIATKIVEAIEKGGIPQVEPDSVTPITSSTVTYSSSNTPQSNFAQFTRSPDFIRFIRGLGKGMVSTGEMGKGIALGSAAAAEEKAKDEKEAKLLAAELAKEKAKIEKENKMSVTDATKLIGIDTTATESASKIVKSQNTRALMTELRTILNNENPTSIGSFAQGILDQAQQLAPDLFAQEFPKGKEYKTLSASLRAKKLATLISQSNIRAILGESSKSISNFDREIVQQLSTQIKLGQPAALNLKSLNELDKALSDDILANYSTIQSSSNRLKQAGDSLGSKSALEILRMYPTLASLQLQQGQEQVQVLDLSGFFE